MNKKKLIVFGGATFVVFLLLFMVISAILAGNAKIAWSYGVMLISAAGIFYTIAFFNFSGRFLAALGVFSLLYLSVPFIKPLLSLELGVTELLNALFLGATLFSVSGWIFFILRKIPLRLPRYLFVALFLCSYALLQLFPLSVWSYYLAMGELISSDIILALFQTNAQESWEYVLSHLNLGWGIALLVIVAVLYLNFRLLKGVESRPFRLRFLSGLFLFVYLLFLVLEMVPQYDYLASYVLRFTGRQLSEFKHYKEVAKNREQMLRSLQGLKTAEGGVFVLVLGESENRDHMGAYGYRRDTTPFLSELLKKNDDKLVVFKNAYASFPQTVPALSYALSQKNQYNDIELSRAFSIIEIAKASGYKTYWLSNQRKYGVYETPITVISSSCDEEFWLNNTSRLYSIFDDGALLQHLPAEIFSDANALLVIHLMGSHQRYKERTPDSFKAYSGGDPNEDAYDDSVRYTDFVLHSLDEELRKIPNYRGLVYLSDHAEELGKVCDHNPTKFSFDMVRIPLVMRFTEEFIKQRSELFSHLRNNTDTVWSNDLLFETMVDILGISGVPDYKAELSLGAEQFLLKKDEIMTMHGKVKVTSDPHESGQ
ncbi:MAG: sulfatase-like hydrolase/transferase [Succinivibrio sp.]|nr:sulfatase-like hydrolase/transferase [Succinivibrio sp.]